MTVQYDYEDADGKWKKSGSIKMLVEPSQAWIDANTPARDPDAMISSLWLQGNDLALAGADHNSREKYLDWKYDPSVAQAAKDKIADINTWMDSIWTEYYSLKARVIAGEDIETFTTMPACPWTFADVMASL